MRVHFTTTRNQNNGYGVTREYFLKYLPPAGVELETQFLNQDISLILNTPLGVNAAKGKIKVLYTMIEGDEIPNEWLPHLQAVDHIIVPTKWVQNVFKTAGFETTVINLGYDNSIFKYYDRPIKNTYTFLHYEAFQDRKGWKELLEAWGGYMSTQEFEAKLILKTILPWNKIPEEVLQYPNVKVVSGELPHHSIYDLLCEVDCFVFPSRGEGFSLPPLEAMATGLPVIVTNAHSHTEYFDESCMYGVECNTKIPASYSMWGNQGSFVRCTSSSLENVLQHVYMHKEEARQKGLLASEYVKKFQYENFAKALSDYLWQL